jgi:hypothetical protein
MKGEKAKKEGRKLVRSYQLYAISFMNFDCQYTKYMEYTNTFLWDV